MSKAKAVQSKSPAEFFAEHKSIAGFDNPGKALYTTVREFVENSLDAAEDIAVLPTVEVIIEHVPALEISDLYGRKDKGADRDKESMGREKESMGKEKEEGETEAARKKRMRTKAFYRVTVKDNGGGMAHDEIPQLLGKVLSGTKYQLKQARGRFGLGAKMALIWSKMTSSLPLSIYTCRGPGCPVSFCSLDLDMHRNEPIVLKHTKTSNDGSIPRFGPGWQGTEISVVIEGNWSNGVGSSYKWKILNYIRRLAVITPYAEVLFRYLDPASSKSNVAIRFQRRTDVMPAPPTPVLHHPSSVDLVVAAELLRRGIEKKQNLKTFLRTSFSNIDSRTALDVISSLGDKYEADMAVADLDKARLQHLVITLTARDWPEPSGDALSPAGTYNLYLGITKELHPTLIATHSERPHVWQGHSFIVEAAVSLGGSSVPPGLSIYRFANRIPLLFETSSDVIAKTANEIRWAAYKISRTEDRIGVFVSIVSTKIPFKGTNKEFISDEIPPIKEAVKNALQKCCAQLKAKIIRQKSAQGHKERKKMLQRYVPDAIRAIGGVLASLAEICEETGEAASKRLRLQSFQVTDTMGVDELVDEARRGTVTPLMHARLSTHVDQYDASEALEYTLRSGKLQAPAESFSINPFALSSLVPSSTLSLRLPRCHLSLLSSLHVGPKAIEKEEEEEEEGEEKVNGRERREGEVMERE